MELQAKTGGGEQYRPKNGATACKPTQSYGSLPHALAETQLVPSKSSVLSELRETEKESPRLRQELATGTSPSALISAALDLENQQSVTLSQLRGDLH